VFAVTGVGIIGGIALLLAGSLGSFVALAFLGVAGGFVRPATLTTLRATLPDAPRLSAAIVVMERAQALVQMVLLLGVGAALQWSVPHTAIVLALLVGAIAFQGTLLGSNSRPAAP